MVNIVKIGDHPCELAQTYELEILRYFFPVRTKMWHMIPVELGCNYFIRYDGTDPNNDIYIFFMHSDDWGQYGPGRISELATFIPEDYTPSQQALDISTYIDSLHRVNVHG